MRNTEQIKYQSFVYEIDDATAATIKLLKSIVVTLPGGSYNQMTEYISLEQLSLIGVFHDGNLPEPIGVTGYLTGVPANMVHSITLSDINYVTADSATELSAVMLTQICSAGGAILKHPVKIENTFTINFRFTGMVSTPIATDLIFLYVGIGFKLAKL